MPFQRAWGHDVQTYLPPALSSHFSHAECPFTRLGMLEYMCAWMQTQNISFFITFGTLLGAVRDEAIIEW